MKRTRYEDDDAFDERGLLKDGGRMRVPTYLMDSSRPGPRYAGLTRDSRDSNVPDRDEMREFSDAEQSAAWRGGLQVGDRVDLAGRSFVVERRDADGSTKLALDRRTAEELKAQAYEAYDADNQAAWRGSDADSVAKEGDACTSDATDSLPNLIQQRDAIMADVYAEYQDRVANAWRSK